MPNVRVIYWSMRVMAYMGMLMLLVAARRRLALLEAETRAGALVPLDGDRRDRVSVHRRDGGLDPDRDGPAAVDRAGLAQDRRRELARRLSTMLAFSLAVFVCLYLLLLVLDIWLMRRYAKLDPPELDRDETGGTPMPAIRY